MFSESPFEGSMFECYWCVMLFSEISSFRDRQGTNESRENKRSKTLCGLLFHYWEKKSELPFRQIAPGYQKACVVF